MGMVRTLAVVTLAALAAAAPINAKPRISSMKGEAAVGLAAVDTSVQIALTRINELRRQAGAAPLVLNTQLTAAAQGHADDMAAKGYFSHASRDGRTPGQRIAATGYRYTAYGENIAWGYADWNAALTAWMGSSGHRANILSTRYREVGLGLKNRYYVADFATPSGVAPVPPPACPIP
jgi:uncharacterized protein YkwD